MPLYCITYADNYQYSECPPRHFFVDVNNEEALKIEDMVHECDAAKGRFFYPQFYIERVELQPFSDVMFELLSLKDDVDKWVKEKEVEEINREKRRELRETNFLINYQEKIKKLSL